MSMRYTAAIMKPGYNATGSTQTAYNLYAMGLNQYGKFGNGTETNANRPVQVVSTTNWKSISRGGQAPYTLAVASDNTLWAWGRNQYGYLGTGNTTYYSSPKQVGALTNWATVAVVRTVSNCASAAVKTDGTLWTWGYNAGGELGLGNRTSYSSPKQVGALTNWASVSGGVTFFIAVKTNGTLWSWGQNAYGQLGLSNRTYYSSPKQVGALTNWASVACGSQAAFVVAVKTDNTLWSWGQNTYGQLGDGTSGTYYSSPRQVGALTNWSSVSCGNAATLAVKTNNTLWAWGYGLMGQLGTNSTSNLNSPTQVGALTNWANVTAGDLQTVSIKTDGTLWSWGNNSYGQLGLQNTTYYSSPKQVGFSTTWQYAGDNYRAFIISG